MSFAAGKVALLCISLLPAHSATTRTAMGTFWLCQAAPSEVCHTLHCFGKITELTLQEINR
jgi:hypothetical protein